MSGHVFVSYGRADRRYVALLAAHLDRAGMTVWWDRNGIRGGDEFERKIAEAIAGSSAVVVVLSPESVRSSWVRREIARAEELHKPILPVLLRSVDTAAMPMQLVGIHCEDVTGGRMPGNAFVARLNEIAGPAPARVAAPSGTSPSGPPDRLAPSGTSPSGPPDRAAPSARSRNRFVGVAVGLAAALLTAVVAGASTLVYLSFRNSRFVYSGHGSASAVAFDPSGGRLVSGGESGTAHIWDAHSHRTIHELPGHEGGIYTVAFSSDGRFVVTSGADGSIRVWDAQTGELRARWESGAPVQEVAVSYDGTLIGSRSGAGESATIWDAASGRRMWTVPARCGPAISPDSTLFAVCDSDGQHIAVMSATTGERLHLLDMGHTGLGYLEGVQDVAFRGDGELLAIRDHGLRTWRVAAAAGDVPSMIAERRTAADHYLTAIGSYGPGGLLATEFWSEGGDSGPSFRARALVVDIDSAAVANIPITDWDVDVDQFSVVGGAALSPDGESVAVASGRGVILYRKDFWGRW